MAANTAPIYAKTPNIGYGTVATANTAKDGTGTVVTVFTAGAEGAFLEKIVFRAAGTNVASVARVFLNNGSTNATAGNNTLFAEISLPATTLNEAGEQPAIVLNMDMRLPAGWKVNITIGTTVAAGHHVTACGGDY